MAVTASALSTSFSAPGVLLTNNFADLLETQFEKVATRVWSDPVEGQSLFNVVNTNKDHILHSYVTQLGLMPRSDDEDDLPVDHPIQGYDNTHTPIDYRLSVRVSKRLRETDQYGPIKRLQSALARSAKQTAEYIYADAFNTGFGTNAQWLCADGMYLFDDSRNYEDPREGTWGNLSATTALTETALEAMRIEFRQTKDERGLITPIMMKTLIVPPDLEKKAFELNASDKRPEDAMNASNFFKGRFTIKVWNYLTSTTAWFGMGPKDESHELYAVWRVKPETKTFLLGNNPDVTVHRVRMSVVTGCDRPHNVRGSLGDGS